MSRPPESLFSQWSSRISARLRRARLPPGEMIPVDQLEKQNRQLLLDLADEHGPVFKGLMEGRHATFIIGLDRARRFLKQHVGHIVPYTLDISSMVPGGFIRQMQGDMHRRYRAQLATASKRGDAAGLLGERPSIEFDQLHRYVTDGDFRAEIYLARLGDIALDLLGTVFFASSDSGFAGSLRAAFMRLGPFGLVWNPGPAQETAMAELRSLLRQALARDSIDPRSILGAAAAAGEVDDTFIGNLIYMVEMGRYDTRGMYRLLSMHAAREAVRLREIGAEAQSGSAQLACAFSDEELRSDQSERLVRRVTRDLKFDGWQIPANSLVRLCMWESHHDPRLFPAPMRFDPDRFLRERIGPDRFSPYGLDRHQCPFADLMSLASVRFLRALACFDLRMRGDANHIRGAFHWEPGFDFSLELTARS